MPALLDKQYGIKAKPAAGCHGRVNGISIRLSCMLPVAHFFQV